MQEHCPSVLSSGPPDELVPQNVSSPCSFPLHKSVCAHPTSRCMAMLGLLRYSCTISVTLCCSVLFLSINKMSYSRESCDRCRTKLFTHAQSWMGT